MIMIHTMVMIVAMAEMLKALLGVNVQIMVMTMNMLMVVPDSNVEPL